MKKLSFILAVFFLAGLGCKKTDREPMADSGPILKVRDLLGKGDYDGALQAAKDFSSRLPAQPGNEESLYLQGYILSYGKTDFQKARLPLKQLLGLYPSGAFAAQAQKLLADGQYWQGHYDAASREYRKLGGSYEDKSYGCYAQLQEAHCLLLDDKVGDAVALYKEIVEKYPTDPLAATAQLMIANSCIKLQNVRQAKTELRKLVAMTKDEDILESAQKALRQIDVQEPLKKDAGVPK
ncbi:MAG TPA: tetratricopeptide repeat protein [bacterium]|nr:tetratricopeptide repeat protein [bacterium]